MARAAENEGHHWTRFDVSWDDQLWVRSMVAFRNNRARILNVAPAGNTPDGVLRTLLSQGLTDHTEDDRPWDSSTRAQRYSAVLVDRLWALLERETTRVCSHY